MLYAFLELQMHVTLESSRQPDTGDRPAPSPLQTSHGYVGIVTGHFTRIEA